MRNSTFYFILILLLTCFGESEIFANARIGDIQGLSNQNTHTITNSELTEVTVYRQGAVITRTGKVDLSEGENLLNIIGLEIGIVSTSIQMSFTDEVGVFSLAYSTDPNRKLEEPDSLVGLRKLLTDITFEKKMLGADIEALQEELAILSSNRTLSVGEGNSEEIARGARLLSERVRENKRGLILLGKELEDLTKKADQVKQRITNIRPELPKDIGQIRATTISKSAGTFTYQISYLVEDAGWTPDYDLFSKTIENQFAELVLVGNIYQRTGVDWKDVELTLSTGNPQQRMMAPSLKRLYLGESNVYSQQSIHGLLLTSDQVSMLGTRPINAIAGLSAGALSDEGDAVSLRGGRSNATKYIIDGHRVTGTLVTESEIDAIQPPSSLIGYSSIGEPDRGYVPMPQLSFAKESSMLTSRTYKIDRVFSLAANGNSSAVRLVSHVLPLDLRYRSVPKIDPAVYLEGIVTGWDTLRLSNGRMRLHLDGRYLGTTVLIANQPSDTLLLPLGVDQRIIIERKSAKQLVDRKPIRSRRNYELGYSITVRNTRDKVINLLIQDQMPMSRKEEAEVSLLSAGLSPKHDTETGIFTWDLTLPAASAEKIDVAYEVTAGKFVKVNFE